MVMFTLRNDDSLPLSDVASNEATSVLLGEAKEEGTCINCEERLHNLPRVRIPYRNQTPWSTNMYVALLMMKRCYKPIITLFRLMSGVHLMSSVQLP